ncbi:coiled coil domain-containing protein [Crotalus adamanteus]|uniref:Coiled coil domain-containing protein n=1 Tax=Crotalus adamanteus TaxID=8729 RepID=A0AAW1BJC4_CROAD
MTAFAPKRTAYALCLRRRSSVVGSALRKGLRLPTRTARVTSAVRGEEKIEESERKSRSLFLAFSMAIVRSRPELYRWRRFNQPASRQKPQFDADNIEHWIKRVEQASEFAVSEAFSLKKTSHSHGFHGPVLDLETTDQLLDHDEAYVEAQELLNDWMNSKLKLELASDEDNDVQNSAPNSVPLQEPVAGFQKYKKFDDFYGYLEQEVESTTVQDFLQHLLQSEIVNSGILEDLKTKGIREKKKPRDLRINMELRHKQVKENRLKKQKELELLKQEKALKKLAVSEAQKQLQEEMKRKDLKAKKEEEEIKKQMVILRKELGEKRYLMEEARKMERKRHNLKKIQSLIEVGLPLADLICLNCDNERQKKGEQDKQLELLSKVNTADQKCLRKYFSAWYKFILDLRIKMGKARALADWKCQLKILRAWRDYSWSHKLEKETQKMENQLRDQNRKNQLAIEFNRKSILRHFFAEWQCWSRLEMEKRDLETKKEKMKRKMARLLEEQRLIEEQQQQLQEQQELIRKLQGLQRLHTAWEEVEQTTTATTVLNINTLKIKKEKQLRENQSNYKNITPERSDVQQPVTQKKRILKALVTPHPLLRAMEERAIQRAERRRQLEEAKQKREDKKLAEMQAKEEERERQEAAEKEAKLEKRREEKRLQQIKELEKQKRLEREQQLLSKAENHYIKILLKQGLKAWKSLIEQSEENMVMAQRHHCTRLQQKCLLAWLHHMQEIQSRKIGQAEDLYCSQLLRRSFRSWIKYKDYILILEESASKVHETALKKKLFGSWFDLVNEEKSILWAKQKTADQYFNRRMILLAFRAWQQFPAQMKEERKKEERLEKLRKRVSEILPNFQA